MKNLYVENEPPEGTGRIRLATPEEILSAARQLTDYGAAKERLRDTPGTTLLLSRILELAGMPMGEVMGKDLSGFARMLEDHVLRASLLPSEPTSVAFEWCETHADQVMAHIGTNACRWSYKVDDTKPCQLVGRVRLVKDA